MKKLVKSNLTDKHRTKCDTLLVSGTLRYVNGGMHECAVCPTKKRKLTFINKLLLKIAR